MELDNPYIADTAMTIARDYPGDYTINQISAIYKTLTSGGWYYYSEGADMDHFQSANLTLQRGMLSGTIGRGDCDDFAILMASLVGSLGGSTRITFAYGRGGHAYAEVYIGERGDQNVEEIIGWIKREYGKEGLPGEGLPGLNYTGDEVWLNLDWSSDYTKPSFPGGPHFGKGDAKYKIYVIWDSGTREFPLVVPIIDDMDSIDGWEKIVDDKGSSANVTSEPGKTEPGRKNMALQISFDLKEGGWAGAGREIDPELLSQAAGLNFSFLSTGGANAIKLRLMQEDGTAFGASWSVGTGNQWSYHRILYNQLKCLSPGDNCDNYGDGLDITKIKRLEFEVLNTDHVGNPTSTGMLLLDQVEGAMAIPGGSPWEGAENARHIYQARSLAVQSKALLEENKDNLRESLLSAIESLALAPTPETYEALANCLVLMPKKVAQYQIPRSSWDTSPLDIDFTPKGIFMSSSAENMDALLWDWHDNVTHPIATNKVWVDIVSYDPEFNRLAAADTYNGLVVIFNLDENTVLRVNSTAEDINHLQFLCNGRYLAVGSYEKVDIWNLLGTNSTSHPHFEKSIYFGPRASDLIFSPDNQYMAVAYKNGSIAVWNWSEGKLVRTVDHGATKYSERVNSISFSQDNRMLATGGLHQGTKIWDIDNEREIVSLDENYNVLKVQFSPQGSLLATVNEFQKDGGQQFSLKIWDLSNVNCSQSAKELMVVNTINPIDKIDFSPDGRYLAVSFIDQQSNDLIVSVWEIATFKERILRNKYDLYMATISPDGKYVAASSWKGLPLTWDWRNGTTFENGSLPSAFGLDFGSQTDILAIASTDGYVRIMSPSLDRELSHLYCNDMPMDVDFNGTEDYLAVGTVSGDVLVWDWRKNISAFNPIRMEETYIGSLRDVEFSPSGREIGIVYEDGEVVVWPWYKNETPKFMDNGERVIASCRFNLNESALYIGCYGGNVTLWDWRHCRKIDSFKGSNSYLVNMALSHDGNFLATGNFDGMARIWNLKDRSEVVRLRHNDEVTGLEFSADGKYLVTSSADRTVRVWLWNPQDLMDEALGRLGYDLTPIERFTYPSIKEAH